MKSSSANSEFMSPQKPPKTIYDDEYVVLDAQRVPPNMLEAMAHRLVKVNRHIQKHFKSEKDLENKLKEHF